MTNIQGDLFNQPGEGPARLPDAAAKAKAQLTEQAKEQRALERQRNATRLEEEAAKRQEETDRALEQGIDLRDERYFRPANAKFFAGRARDEIKKVDPKPESEDN